MARAPQHTLSQTVDRFTPRLVREFSATLIKAVPCSLLMPARVLARKPTGPGRWGYLWPAGLRYAASRSSVSRATTSATWVRR